MGISAPSQHAGSAASDGGITVQGGGTLTLNPVNVDNGYTGPTIVSSGTTLKYGLNNVLSQLQQRHRQRHAGSDRLQRHAQGLDAQ